LVGTLLVDTGIKIVFQYPNISFEITGPEIAIAIGVIITFICAIVCDTIDSKRQHDIRKSMLEALQSPYVPDEAKKNISTEIFKI
jgi:hypothetical protein